MYRYEVFQMKPLFASSNIYGILAKEYQDGSWIPVAVAAPFSNNRVDVANLAETCSSLQLSPMHLIDVVSDFISHNAFPT